MDNFPHNLKDLKFDLTIRYLDGGSKKNNFSILSEFCSRPVINLLKGGDKVVPKDCIDNYFNEIERTSLIVGVKLALADFEEKVCFGNHKHFSQEESEFVFIKKANSYKKVLWKNIVHFQALSRYTKIQTIEKQEFYLIRGALKDALHSVIPESRISEFIQINRSEIIHKKYLEEVNEHKIKTQFGFYKIGDTFKRDVLKAINHIN